MQTRQSVKQISIFITVTTLILSSTRLRAQEYKYEIGARIGSTFYMGDANKTRLFYHPGVAVGGMYRYNINFHWAAKGSLTGGTISGDTKTSDEVFPRGKSASFKRVFIDLSGQIEYNFFALSDKYKYLNTKPYSPYILAGLGGTFGSGNPIFLNANISLGAGFKYKIKNRLNVGFEWSIKKLFSDDFDVSDKNDEWNLNAPYGIKSGILKNQDWYSLTMIFVTWEFGLRQDPCHGG